MNKKVFAIRLILYILIGIVLPIGFLAWRFDLFQTVTKVSFSMWGVIAIVTFIVLVLGLFKGLKKGMKPGIAKQVIDTICSVTLPLVIVAIVFEWLSDFSTEFVQFLIVLIICETIAGIVNPIPQWELENNIEATENIVQRIINIFTNK